MELGRLLVTLVLLDTLLLLLLVSLVALVARVIFLVLVIANIEGSAAHEQQLLSHLGIEGKERFGFHLGT